MHEMNLYLKNIVESDGRRADGSKDRTDFESHTGTDFTHSLCVKS